MKTSHKLAAILLASALTAGAMAVLGSAAQAASPAERWTLETEIKRSFSKAFAAKPLSGGCWEAIARINPGTVIPRSILSRLVRQRRVGKGARVKVKRKPTTTLIGWMFEKKRKCILIRHDGKGHQKLSHLNYRRLMSQT